MSINFCWSETPCKVLPHGLKIIIEKLRKQTITKEKKVVYNLKAVGPIVTKNTIGNTQGCNGLKSYYNQKISLLQMAHIPVHVSGCC